MSVVTLLGSDDDPEAIRAGVPFVDRWWTPTLHRPRAALRSVGAALTGRSLQVELYRSAAARAATGAALAAVRPDVVVAHLVRTVSWLPDRSPPVIVDIQDALSTQYERASQLATGWRGLAMRLEQGRIAPVEQAAIARADGVSFITEQDRTLLGPPPSVPSVVCRAVIDADRFTPPSAGPERALIGFAGKLATASNRDMAVHFARRILPLVRSARPEVRLEIVGVEAPAEVRRLDRLPGVRVVGAVDDMAAALGRFDLTVCPLRFGSGVQNKVLESLAVGTPAVVSPSVASSLEGSCLPALGVAAVGRPFAMTLVELIADRGRRDRMSAAGVEFVRRVHSPQAAMQDLLELVESLARRERR